MVVREAGVAYLQKFSFSDLAVVEVSSEDRKGGSKASQLIKVF